jgi:hypothetical protein
VAFSVGGVGGGKSPEHFQRGGGCQLETKRPYEFTLIAAVAMEFWVARYPLHHQFGEARIDEGFVPLGKILRLSQQLIEFFQEIFKRLHRHIFIESVQRFNRSSVPRNVYRQRPPSPLFLGFAFDRRCSRVLALDPVSRSAREIGRAKALRYDAFKAELAAPFLI